MENILIVTVGMRDIQVSNHKELNFRPPHFTLYENKNVPGYKLFSKPVIAGASIIKNKLTDFVEYPIIKPAIDFLINKGKTISDLILICTAQEIEDTTYTDNDTIYFAKIIAQLIRKHYTIDQVVNIHDLLVVKKDVNNYGKMYEFFNRKLPQIITNQDNCNLYIFPQGGINAINFGALLKSIELFPKTHHLCKSEASIEVEISDFPNKFRTSIESQKITSLIEKFYYHEVYSSDPYINKMTAYAQERLLFNYEGAYYELHNSKINSPLIEILKSRSQDLYNKSKDNDMSYLKDLYLAIKIVFHKQDYSAFIFKIYALCESYLKDEVCKYLNVENCNDKRTEDEIVSFIDTKNDNLKKYLITRGVKMPFKLNANNYIAVCDYFDPNLKCNDVFIKKSLSLNNFRNNIAHFAKNIALEEIINTFSRIETSITKMDAIDLYFQQGDEFWGVSGFGDYDIINEAIKTRLLTNKTT